MDVDALYVLADFFERGRQGRAEMFWLNDVDSRVVQQRALERVYVARPDQTHALIRDWRESGNCGRELCPAAASNDRHRSPIQKSARRRLRGTEIAVRV